jgi:hypothetical protein
MYAVARRWYCWLLHALPFNQSCNIAASSPYIWESYDVTTWESRTEILPLVKALKHLITYVGSSSRYCSKPSVYICFAFDGMELVDSYNHCQPPTSASSHCYHCFDDIVAYVEARQLFVWLSMELVDSHSHHKQHEGRHGYITMSAYSRKTLVATVATAEMTLSHI